MKSLILNIGDELLIGQVVNTNASYIAKELNRTGIVVEKILVVKDNKESIFNALEEGQKYDLVILTGGLGPTKDDITKHCLAEYMNDVLIENTTVLEDIKNLLANKGKQMNELNRRQAQVLSQCKIIRNHLGTAPGMIMKKKETTYVSLPGVPFEMKPMFQFFLKAFVKENQSASIIHKTVLVFGIPESELSLKIEDWENNLHPKGIQLAYLPNRNLIRLRLSCYNASHNTEKQMLESIEELKQLLDKHFVGTEEWNTHYDNPLAAVIIDKLRERKWTIAFAESCTGGSIASAITKIPGASDVFLGSVISYSNEMKMKLLDVKEETINKYGAVSKECVIEMLNGVQKLMNTDIALSVSGIAGPSGGTANKPVGTIWMALYFKGQTETKLFQFGENSRDFIIDSAVFSGLAWILKKINQIE